MSGSIEVAGVRTTLERSARRNTSLARAPWFGWGGPQEAGWAGCRKCLRIESESRASFSKLGTRPPPLVPLSGLGTLMPPVFQAQDLPPGGGGQARLWRQKLRDSGVLRFFFC